MLKVKETRKTSYTEYFLGSDFHVVALLLHREKSLDKFRLGFFSAKMFSYLFALHFKQRVLATRVLPASFATEMYNRVAMHVVDTGTRIGRHVYYRKA